MLEEKAFGTIVFRLEEVIKARNISKNKVANRAEIGRGQLNRYCKNQDIQRVDLAVLSRLCHTLHCSVGDLLEYLPPDSPEK